MDDLRSCTFIGIGGLAVRQPFMLHTTSHSGAPGLPMDLQSTMALSEATRFASLCPQMSGYHVLTFCWFVVAVVSLGPILTMQVGCWAAAAEYRVHSHLSFLLPHSHTCLPA